MATKAYYIPNGPKNLATVFPAIDFNDVSRYYLEVKDSDNTVVATTTINDIGGCCDDDQVRIHFLNYLGTIDAVNFILQTKEHEPKSDNWQKQISHPLVKTDHGTNRNNVKSNDTLIALTTDYTEEHQDWLDELMDSPVAWFEWTGTQGQPDSFIPIIISDIKREKVKVDDRYTYEIKIEFKISHERFIIRN